MSLPLRPLPRTRADGDTAAPAFAPRMGRGLLTLVACHCKAGLQVQACDGAWLDVPLGYGRVALLPGFSLHYALGGVIRPAVYRVAPGSSGVFGQGLVALEFELCCHPAAVVDPAAVLRGASAAVLAR